MTQTEVITCESSSNGTLSRRSSNGLSSNNNEKLLLKNVGSSSSIDSLDQEAYFSDCYSDDLDKLSTCLSEVSSEEDDPKRNNVVQDLIQAQLAFWTLVFSFLYSYAWQQHRKKFLMSIFVGIPLVLIVCFTIAWLLGTIVVLSRLFSTSLKIEEMLKYGKCDNEADLNRRRRTLSNASRSSLVSYSERSSSCEELPKPVCRKHSSSNSSLNQILMSNGCGIPLSNGSRAVSPTFSFTRQISASSPTRKLSYAYTHQTADDDEGFESIH
jgi:hypothetical protein